MASSVDDIILASHDVEVPILIKIPGISSIVVTHESREVLLNVDVIVVKDGLHERWGQWLLYVYSASLICLAFDTSGRVDHLNIVPGKWFTSRPWLLWEGLEPKVVGKDRSSSLSLPIAIIDQFALKVIFHPLESRNVAAFPDESDALKVVQIVLVNIFSL